MIWLSQLILGSSIMCSTAGSVEVLLKYKGIGTYYIHCALFFLPNKQKKEKMSWLLPSRCTKTNKGSNNNINLKNSNQNKTEHPMSEKRWFTFPPFHPSIPFHPILFIGKWTTWQSLMEAFSGIAGFLKAKRNKPKHTE